VDAQYAVLVLHDAFSPIGAPPSARGIEAVSVGAGAIWGEVYKKVAVEGGRYVQDRGCLTVGVAGFIQGGGFGSFSKAYSTGAANLLEAEVVTADGEIRIANAYQEPELFYALKGGGGGTYGVVTRLTLKTHPLPSTIGAILFSVQAKSPAAWRALVARMIDFYADALFSPVWGEQMNFRPGLKLSVSMLCNGLDEPAVKAVWESFLSWIRQRPQDYMIAGQPMVLSMPAQHFWDPSTLKSIPGVVLQDGTPGAPKDNIFWATNQGEAGQVLHAYQSAWMPSYLLDKNRQSELVDALVEASVHWAVGLHTNKGLAGGTPEALEAAKATATNPEVGEAFPLLICAAEGSPAWPGVPGHEPDAVTGRSEAAKVARAMTPIHALVPGAGSYVSEADYFGDDWQRAYWGANYRKLVAVKRRYDPGNLFKGHHCVA
jgi:FAD/FMN-containing dehydrogenase